MRSRTRWLLTMLVAAFAFATASGLASAESGIDVEPAGEFLAIADELVFSGGAAQVTCGVTLHGSLHEQIDKRGDMLAGYVTSGASDGCTSNVGAAPDVDLLFPAPWHISYRGFTGELPDINTLLLLVEDAEFLLEIPFDGAGGIPIECLFSGNVDAITNTAVAANGLSSIIADESTQIPLVRTLGVLGAFCPAEGTLDNDPFVLHDPVDVILVNA